MHQTLPNGKVIAASQKVPVALSYSNTVHSDTAAVRKGEEIDASKLAAYLDGKVPGIDSGLTIEQFPGGHSNLTYLLRAGGSEYVLRRAPLGPVAPKAHDMAREFAVLAAVHPHFPEAPRVHHLCEDPSIIGAVFFIMDRRRGTILRDTLPTAIETQPDHARRISDAFIDCHARLHAIDIRTTGLHALGKPEGFVQRQVGGWADRWNRSKTDELPQMDTVIAWLQSRLPSSTEATLVHNDYKLDNVMLAADNIDRIEAVLDWEMTTVGDPLADVGLTLCYWAWANSPAVRAAGIPAITSQPGWYTREQFIERYAVKTGRDLTGIGYYEVLGVFKLAVIIQQIYYRFWRGQTNDERFRDFGERTKGLVHLAASLVERFA
jgi:aminoglycoside phosphotransferase (APT) family kinase protein